MLCQPEDRLTYSPVGASVPDSHRRNMLCQPEDRLTYGPVGVSVPDSHRRNMLCRPEDRLTYGGPPTYVFKRNYQLMISC
jgi:hypothetical protein